MEQQSYKNSILIVDDHPLVGDGIASMVMSNGIFEIIGHCRTGEEAMLVLQSVSPDIILLDINLPDANGLDLCETFRKKHPETKIVGLTSTNEVGIISQFLVREGMDTFLKALTKLN